MFRVTWVDYLILVVAMIVFLHGFFTIKYVEIINPLYPRGRPEGIGMEMSVQVIIAPIIILHRIFIIAYGPYTPRLREIDWKLKRFELLELVRNKLEEGKKQYQDYRNNNRK